MMIEVTFENIDSIDFKKMMMELTMVMMMIELIEEIQCTRLRHKIMEELTSKKIMIQNGNDDDRIVCGNMT